MKLAGNASPFGFANRLEIVRQLPQLGPGLDQLALGRLSLRNVAGNADSADDAAGLIANRRFDRLEPARQAGRVRSCLFVAASPAALEHRSIRSQVDFGNLRRPNLVSPLAEHQGLRHSQDFQVGSVDRQISTVTILQVRYVVEQCALLLLSVLARHHAYDTMTLSGADARS